MKLSVISVTLGLETCTYYKTVATVHCDMHIDNENEN